MQYFMTQGGPVAVGRGAGCSGVWPLIFSAPPPPSEECCSVWGGHRTLGLWASAWSSWSWGPVKRAAGSRPYSGNPVVYAGSREGAG